MTTEGTTAPAGAEQGGEQAPDLSVWNDQTRDAIIEKYGNDPASLARGYWNSQQAYTKAGEDAKSISNERADFVQQRQEWEAERVGHASALEAANESVTTAADINKNVFGAVQDDLVANDGKVSDETRKAMLEVFDGDQAFVDRHIKLVQADVNERFAVAQESAPQGTDVKALLNFVNTDAVKTEGSVFSAAELEYFQDRANKGDYGFVAQVETKYLESLGKNEKAVKAAKVPQVAAGGTTQANPKDSFASQAEYDAAKKDPKFHADYEFRQEVERKYRNSDVKAMADAKMAAIYGPNWDASGPAIRGG